MCSLRSIILVTILAIMTLIAGIQADPWSKSLATDFTLTQNSYSNSWKGGEAGNISWVWNLNSIFEKPVSPIFTFKNTDKLAFGQTHIQDKTTKQWAKPQKSTDLIDIENLGLFTLQTYVDPFVALRLETQFVDASVSSKYRYFSPAKITESAGVARIFYKKDKDQFMSRLGFALRQIITQEITDTSMASTKSTTTNDGGLESVTDFQMSLAQNLRLTSKLTLYKALFFSEADEVKGTPMEDYWKAIDVNLENSLAVSVVKYVTVSLYMQLLYDKQIDLRGRFKESLALGLTYTLF